MEKNSHLEVLLIPAHPDELVGLCSIFEDEWGYVSLSGLEGVQGPLGVGLEQDLYWTSITIQALKDRLVNGDRP